MILTLYKHYIKLRNRMICKSPQIDPLNVAKEYEEASLDTLLFHHIMKGPLRQFIKMLPDIPDDWISGLTGNRKVMYETIKAKWYDVDDNQERREKFWKPFLFFLCYWEYDTAGEFIEASLFEVLERRWDYYFKCDKLDPTHWYSDKKGGRIIKSTWNDPAVSYSSIVDLSLGLKTTIKLESKPLCNAVGVPLDGVWHYVIIDKEKELLDGSLLFEVVAIHTDLGKALEQAFVIETRNKCHQANH